MSTPDDLADAGIPGPPQRGVLGPEPGLDERPLLSYREATRKLDELAVLDARKARRERIATAVLAGMAANSHDDFANFETDEELVGLALLWTDMLIAELDQ